MQLEDHRINSKVENVVATATLPHKLDLELLARFLDNGRYNPEEFPGVICQIKRPKAAALIFSSGKIVCVGTKSERQARKALLKLVDDIKMNGIVIIGEPRIKVRNVVASADLCGRIDLEKAAYTLQRTIYDPEQFPGLIYRLADPQITFLIFAEGKVVCAGAKSAAEIYEGIARLENNLRERNLILKGREE